MGLRFTVLASGSGGNASLLESGGWGVLIDIGLGPRQLAARLAAVGSSWEHIHAVVLTHLHTDHCKERTLLHLGQRGIPLYCHPEHAQYMRKASRAFAALFDRRLVREFEPGRAAALGPELACRAFELSHDGGVTCGFRFQLPPSAGGRPVSLAYAADLGCWHDRLAAELADVDLLALEFNHDVELERSSGRPWRLIARVLGDHGHLSNDQAAGLLGAALRLSEPGRLRHLVQLHLSRDCNRPELALAAAQHALARHRHTTMVHTAGQDRPGPRLAIDEVHLKGPYSNSNDQLVPSAPTCQQTWLPGWEE